MTVSIAKKFDSIDNLPTMPQTLQKILDSMDDITTSSKTIEEIIREDPAITARILHIANSPYYGLPGEVTSIARAVTVLGFEEVKGLVVGLSLSGAFSGDLGFDEFDGFGMWLHSIAVARSAMKIAEHVDGTEPDELFTVGLLHDIGRFLMCIYCKDDVAAILRLMSEKGLSLHEAENEYEFSHAEAGAYIARKWELADLIVDVIRYHHTPRGAGPHSKYASIIFLADELCHKLAIGWTMDNMVEKFLVPKELGLASETVKQIASDMKKTRKSFIEAWQGAYHLRVFFVSDVAVSDKIKVIVVDDTAFMRKALVEILSSDPDMEVIGVARHGRELLDMLASMSPDIVTLDVDMPVMDGLTALKHVMVRHPMPVVMVSGLAYKGDVTFEALRLGAVDFFPKPSGTISLNIHESKLELNRLVKQAARINPFAIKRAGIPRLDGDARWVGSDVEKVLAVIAPQGATGHLIRLLANIPVGSGIAVFVFQDFSDEVLQSYSEKMDEILPWKTVSSCDKSEVNIKAGECFLLSSTTSVTLKDSSGLVASFMDSSNGVGESVVNLSSFFEKKFINIILGGADLTGLDAIRAVSNYKGVNLALSSNACVYKDLSDAAIREGVAESAESEQVLWNMVKEKLEML
jgi:two-component system chemotaxis response regulator CheB